jgi:hypothetical protein
VDLASVEHPSPPGLSDGDWSSPGPGSGVQGGGRAVEAARAGSEGEASRHLQEDP